MPKIKVVTVHPPVTPFPCHQCGLCCQQVHRSAQTAFLDRGDGTCRHYQVASKRCAIYEQRPDVCRVDRQYALHYAERCTWDEFVAANLQVCAWLQEVA